MKKTTLKLGLVIILLLIIISVIFKFSGKRELQEETNIEDQLAREDLETLEEVQDTEDLEETESSNPELAEGELPKHILTGYWHNFDNGAECLKISDVPMSYNLIAVAFADATSVPGAVEFNLDPTLFNKIGGYTENEFIKDIAGAIRKAKRLLFQ